MRPAKIQDNLETHRSRATNSTWHARFRNGDVHILRYLVAWPRILYQLALSVDAPIEFQTFLTECWATEHGPSIQYQPLWFWIQALPLGRLSPSSAMKRELTDLTRKHRSCCRSRDAIMCSPKFWLLAYHCHLCSCSFSFSSSSFSLLLFNVWWP